MAKTVAHHATHILRVCEQLSDAEASAIPLPLRAALCELALSGLAALTSSASTGTGTGGGEVLIEPARGSGSDFSVARGASHHALADGTPCTEYEMHAEMLQRLVATRSALNNELTRLTLRMFDLRQAGSA